MEEAQKLKDEAIQRASAIEEKYKNGLQHVGIDGNLELEERREITHWFGQEVKRLRKKYGIEE